ncbi:MAG: hypothetical protein GY719_38350, partial [bacterium]|nr:hypothetical protein [bacterium]
MAQSKKPAASKGKTRRIERFDLIFEERKEDDARPEAWVVAVDSKRRTLETADVAEDGSVAIKSSTLKRAETFYVGPQGVDFATARDQYVPYHAHQIRDAITAESAISLTRRAWLPFLQLKLCVSGNAKHCHWHPWWTEINNFRLTTLADRGNVVLSNKSYALADVLEPVFPGWKHCKPLCDGVVEVYRRTCCCGPIVVFDPRIPEIIERLEELTLELPPVGPPLPDPPPFERLPFHKAGTPDKLALSAEADLKAVKTLSGQHLVDYINARHYLYCWCSPHKQVANGFLQPDGSFNICWWEPLRIMFPGCRDRIAFKVKQLIDGDTVTVYDGVAANRWFGYDSDICLETFNPDAIVCETPPDPPPGTNTKSVMLELIGSTESRHLNSPLPDGWSSINPPDPDHGLAFPAAPPADPATLQYKNLGWGKNLALRYLFFEDLATVDARYFRVSVARSDGNGNPTGTRKYLDHPLAWVWYRRRNDGTIVREVEPLKDGQHYKIPYESLYQAHLGLNETGKWAGRQSHAFIDTTKFLDTRYLVTIELYNGAKQQIEPAGAGEGTIAKNFNFQAWDQNNLAATVPVVHKGLTHLFWWDNQDTTAEIVGIPGVGDCQFLEGPAGTNVAMNYRAYHPTPRFLYFHNVKFQKGLHGGWQTWVANNALSHSAPAGVPTPSRTYADMLDGEPHCTFGVEVRTYAKITTGSARVQQYDDRDNGSFAI